MFKIEEKIEQMNVLQDENEISNLQDIRKELSNLKQKIDLEDSKNIQKFNQFEERLNKLEDECCEKDKKRKIVDIRQYNSKFRKKGRKIYYRYNY